MDYQNGLIINTKRDVLYNATTHKIDAWWGRTDIHKQLKLGDEFSVFFEEGTVWKFKIIELIHDEKVVWNCIEAHHKIVGLENIEEEWLNSQLVWRFEKMSNNEVLLVFEHIGLIPLLNCYEVCNKGWNYFLKSLKQYAETGVGTPNIIE